MGQTFLIHALFVTVAVLFILWLQQGLAIVQLIVPTGHYFRVPEWMTKSATYMTG